MIKIFFSLTLDCVINPLNLNEETLRKAIYEANVMSVLNELFKHLICPIWVLIHFGSLYENLLELDKNSELFNFKQI